MLSSSVSSNRDDYAGDNSDFEIHNVLDTSFVSSEISSEGKID